MRAAGVDMFTSPHLPNYPYSKSKPNYSPPVTVAKKGLSVPVPKDGASYFELSFDNGDSNVELMLPLRFNMTCSGGPCTSLPLLPQVKCPARLPTRTHARRRSPCTWPAPRLTCHRNSISRFRNTVSVIIQVTI